MAHLAVGVLNPKSKRRLIKGERAGKARSKRPHRSYRASTYLTVAECAALERAAAAKQRTVAGLVRAIVLGSLGQEKAGGGPAPNQTPPGEQKHFSVAAVAPETPRQQGQDGSKRAEWERRRREDQELREEVEVQALKSQREKDLHWISKELGKGLEG